MDDYFGVLNQFTEHVEKTDSQLLSGRDKGVLLQIQQLKHDCLKLRRTITPLREILICLTRGDYGFFRAETVVYLRDAYDHTMHVMESLEMSREMVGDMLDLYLSTQSHRLNIQMRVLTVITMIFMPLTLIAEHLWHELRIHAGIALALWLFCRPRFDGGHCGGPRLSVLALPLAIRYGFLFLRLTRLAECRVLGIRPTFILQVGFIPYRGIYF
ncbi:CorA family divalent cation transporter [Paludibacterium denitrificans]|uniref:CorA family divalent cation transporter n=1 Tax=Paludibacterium denitrificans TaxID=2675226 RepID=UPI00406BC9BA